MMGLLRPAAGLIGRNYWSQSSNFTAYTSAGEYTTVKSNSGTIAAGDYSPSNLLFTPDTANNDYCYLRTTNANWLLPGASASWQDKPLVGEWIFQFSEVATNAANVGVGFCNSVAAGTLIDDGGGPVASFSGAMIYKIDGGTVWKCTSSVGTTNTTSTSTITAGGSGLIRARIEVRFVNGVPEITYWLGNVPSGTASSQGIQIGQLLDSTTLRPIKHTIGSSTITSAAQMQQFAGVKNGTAASQAMRLHYMAGAQAY